MKSQTLVRQFLTKICRLKCQDLNVSFSYRLTFCLFFSNSFEVWFENKRFLFFFFSFLVCLLFLFFCVILRFQFLLLFFMCVFHWWILRFRDLTRFLWNHCAHVTLYRFFLWCFAVYFMTTIAIYALDISIGHNISVRFSKFQCTGKTRRLTKKKKKTTTMRKKKTK